MKKCKYLYPFLSIILLTTACGPSEADKEKERQKRIFTENPIQWNTYSATEQIPFDKDTLHVSYTLDLEYTYPQEYSNELIKSKLTTILNSEIWGQLDADIDGNYPPTEEYINNYVTKQKDAYIEQLNEQLPVWNGRNGDSLFTAKQKISTKVLFNEANFVSYQVLDETSRGSATPNTSFTYITLDVAEGKKLTEKDLYKADYQEELNKRLVNKLVNAMKMKDAEELKESDFWGVYDISSNDNFLLTRNNICYIINPQEYASKEKGVIRLCFTYEELKDLFSENSPLNIFVQTTDKQ